MATIVLHKDSGRRFALLGTSHSAHWDVPRNKLGLLIGPHTPQQTDSVVSVCGENGKILHFAADELLVISIDGRRVAELFKDGDPYR